MSSNVSDVNIIFAHTDLNHKFHSLVSKKVESIKNEEYILLNHVRTVFIYTYSSNLKTIGDMIISSVNTVKKNLSERKSKIEPTNLIKNSYLNAELKRLIDMQKDLDMSSTDYEFYKNILLKDYPLLELLRDIEKLKEFDTIFIEKADEIANDRLKFP